MGAVVPFMRDDTEVPVELEVLERCRPEQPLLEPLADGPARHDRREDLAGRSQVDGVAGTVEEPRFIELLHGLDLQAHCRLGKMD